jgi:flagellar biosynthesis/type III secretory pathway chaperone
MEDEALDKLIAILTRETEILQGLHNLLAAQQQELVRGNTEGIKQSVEGQIETLGEISNLERERVSLLGALRLDGEDQKEDVTLSRLIEIAPQHGDRLREVRLALKEVLEAIGTLNQRNGMLINQSLAYIGKTLRAMAGEDKSSTVYTADGDLTCTTGRLAVDRRI